MEGLTRSGYNTYWDHHRLTTVDKKEKRVSFPTNRNDRIFTQETITPHTTHTPHHIKTDKTNRIVLSCSLFTKVWNLGKVLLVQRPNQQILNHHHEWKQQVVTVSVLGLDGPFSPMVVVSPKGEGDRPGSHPHRYWYQSWYSKPRERIVRHVVVARNPWVW